VGLLFYVLMTTMRKSFHPFNGKEKQADGQNMGIGRPINL